MKVVVAKMSAPAAGHEFPPNDVAWQKRDVLLFANSIGCTADELHFLFVSASSCQDWLHYSADNAVCEQELHPNFSDFPTYPLILRKR